MGFGDASIHLKVAFVLIIVGVLVQILALALPYWYSKDYSNNTSYNGGLFRGCAEWGNTKRCSNINNPSGEVSSVFLLQ